MPLPGYNYEEAVEWIRDDWKYARVEFDHAVTKRNSYPASMPPGSDDDVWDYTQILFGMIKNLIEALALLTDKTEFMGKTYHAVPEFLNDYTQEEYEGEEYVLTWKEIIKAWSEISDAARMWTITSIDQMRQSIWHKPTEIKWTENPFE